MPTARALPRVWNNSNWIGGTLKNPMNVLANNVFTNIELYGQESRKTLFVGFYY